MYPRHVRFSSHYILYAQVFQSAILEAKKYKESGGDALADMLDLLSDSKVR
jgi:hypothetical protein